MWTRENLPVCVKEKNGEKGEFHREWKKGEDGSSGLRSWNKPVNESPWILYPYLATLKFTPFKRVSSQFQAVDAIHSKRDNFDITLVSSLDI